MTRTQILLEPWQHQALHALAARQSKSLSALLREMVTSYLGSAGASAGRLQDIEGVFSDPTAAGRDHDRFLYGRGPPGRDRPRRR